MRTTDLTIPREVGSYMSPLRTMVIMIPVSNLPLEGNVVGLFDCDASNWYVTARRRSEHDVQVER